MKRVTTPAVVTRYIGDHSARLLAQPGVVYLGWNTASVRGQSFKNVWEGTSRGWTMTREVEARI
jgi:hypothetical protein